MLDALKKYMAGRPAQDLGSPARVILTVLATFIASQLIAAFVVELILALVHPGSVNQDFFNNSIAAQFFFVLVAEALAALITIKLVLRRRLGFGFIGLGRRPTWDDAGRAIIGFAAFYGLIIVAGLVLTLLIPSFNTNQAQNLGFNNINSSTDNLLTFLALVILPPLGEEPLVRGYLFCGLRSRWKFLPAMLVTSLLFGAAHLEIGGGSPLVWGAALDTFILSLVLVYLRETTGALYAGALVHMLNNLVAFGVHFHL